MVQDEKLLDKARAVREFKYLGDRLSAAGGCDASVTDRTRGEWFMFRECGTLLYEKSYVSPVILCESEA